MQIPIQALMQMGSENPLLGEAGLAPAQAAPNGGLFAQLLQALQESPPETGAASGLRPEQAIASALSAARAAEGDMVSALGELVPTGMADRDAAQALAALLGSEAALAVGDGVDGVAMEAGAAPVVDAPAGESAGETLTGMAVVMEPEAGFPAASAAMADAAVAAKAGAPVPQSSVTAVERAQEADGQTEAVVLAKVQPGAKTGAKGATTAGQAVAAPASAEAESPVATPSQPVSAPAQPDAVMVEAKANAEGQPVGVTTPKSIAASDVDAFAEPTAPKPSGGAVASARQPVMGAGSPQTAASEAPVAGQAAVEDAEPGIVNAKPAEADSAAPRQAVAETQGQMSEAPGSAVETRAAAKIAAAERSDPVQAPRDAPVSRGRVVPEQGEAFRDGAQAARTEPRAPSAAETPPVTGKPVAEHKPAEAEGAEMAVKPSGTAKPESGADTAATAAAKDAAARRENVPAPEAPKPAPAEQVRTGAEVARGPASPPVGRGGEPARTGADIPREVAQVSQALADEQARLGARMARPAATQVVPDTQRDGVNAPVLQAEAVGDKLRARPALEDGKPACPVAVADDDGVASESSAPLLGKRASVPKSWLAPERPVAQANSEASVDAAMAGPQREDVAGLKSNTPEPVFRVLSGKAAVAEPVQDVGAQQTPAEPGQGPAVGVEQASAKPMPQGAAKAPVAPQTPEEPLTLDSLRDPVVRQVRYLVSRGEQTLRVRLKPASLGELRIEVASGGESVSVRLVSANPVVREALEGQAGGLRQALSAEGIDVTDVLVSADASYEQASQGQAGRGAMQPQHSGRPAQSYSQTYNGSQPKDSPTRQSRRHHDGGLNLYA